MKVLLAGRSGQIGARLERMLGDMAEVVPMDRATADFAQPEAVRRMIRAVRPDVIVNAAGYTDVDRAESDTALAYAVNAEAPGVMAQEAKRLGALFVHYSSAFVFDGTANRAYLESDAPNPVNEYGRSKLAGEQAVAAAGGAHIILRSNWVYDVRGRNFVLTVLRLAAERDEMHIVDDQVGTPTWARAIAAATASILRDVEHAKASTGVYHLTALGGVTRYDFARRILALAKEVHGDRAMARLTPIRTCDYPLPAARPLNSQLDTAKLRRTFGVELEDWETQLSACMSTLAGREAHNEKAIITT